MILPGSRVRTILGNQYGFVATRIHSWTQSIGYWVQLDTDLGHMSAYGEAALEIVEGPPDSYSCAELDNIEDWLGTFAIDRITGWRGFIVSLEFNCYGAIYVKLVDPNLDERGEIKAPVTLLHQQLQSTGERLA